MLNQNLKLVLSNFLMEFTAKYNPQRIICFACIHDSRSSSGCFLPTTLKENFHFFLVVILPDARSSLMNNMQDYANCHFNRGRITIIAQSWESIIVSLDKGKTFYNYVLRTGITLYSNDNEHEQFIPPDIDHIKALQLAEKSYQQRKEMARGFLFAAENCINAGYYSNALFFLHQATEQACIQAIRLNMSYRCEIHNIDRLLDLTQCFKPGLDLLFPRRTERQRILFNSLKESYSSTRYRIDFKTNKEDVYELYEQVEIFVREADVISFRKLGQLTKAAQEAAEMHADFKPALSTAQFIT